MAGTGFVTNGYRYDPYKTFKFQVKDTVTNRTIFGVHKCGPLKRTTDVVKYAPGGVNNFEFKSSGNTHWDAVTMERGITHNTDFEDWANMTASYLDGGAVNLVSYKRDLILEVMNERSQVALRYFLHQCWVSEFQTLPELDAAANGTAIEVIKIELQGWWRDTDLKEPDQSQPVPPPPA